jgi:predicted RecA/RadA family phage recombinase
VIHGATTKARFDMKEIYEEDYPEEGDAITIPAPAGGVRRGEFVIVEKLGGVAAHAANEGEEVEIALEGCFDFPKVSGAISLGAPVYWSAGAKKVTATAQGNARIGVAIGAASSDAEEVRVRLDGFLA